MITEVLFDQFDSDSWEEYSTRLNTYNDWLTVYVGREDDDWHWHPVYNGVSFEREEDAVIFKLRFRL